LNVDQRNAGAIHGEQRFSHLRSLLDSAERAGR
jgi:hypothetical protein